MASRSVLFTKNLLQTAVYWGAPVSDGYTGYTFAAGVEIACRWEQKQELFIDREGQEKRSLAVVYLGQDIVLGGRLYLGNLSDLGASPDPQTVSGAYEIRAWAKIPTLCADLFQRKAWL